MSKVPSASLRDHAAKASKSRTPNTFSSKHVPKVKKGTFTGDDSDSSSSSGDSDSIEIMGVTNYDFLNKHNKLSTPASKRKANGAGATIPERTPAKSPTVNGLGASMAKKEQLSAKQIKKEDSSSEEESSSDEKTKATKNGKGKKIKKSESGSDTSSSSEASSSSESERESDKVKKSKSKSASKSKSPEKNGNTKSKAKGKSPVKKEASSESESSSAESESEDPAKQIEDQIRSDLTSVSSQTSKAQKSNKEPSSKKAKRTASPAKDEDGDIDMMDQSTALTNGGKPTNVGDVPEFVAPDFYLRKVEGTTKAVDIANFFSKAQLDGKQVWYITAPASLPVTVVQDLSIPMDKAQQGLPVLNHNGDDYRMAFENPSASSSFRLLIPSKKGDEYTLLQRPVDQTMHFTRSETFPPDGPSSVVTTQTITTTKPARPQPEGLRARYTPLGVPTPKPTTAPVHKAVASVAAAEGNSSSPKKKRKHRDDGENGSVATPAFSTPIPAPSRATSGTNKNPSAEKPAKKQKTNRQGTSIKKETPVPLPQLGAPFSNAMNSLHAAGQLFSSLHASPGAARPATQAPQVPSRLSSNYARPATQIPSRMSPGYALHATQVPSRVSPDYALPTTEVPSRFSSGYTQPTTQAPQPTRYSLDPMPFFPVPSSPAVSGPVSTSPTLTKKQQAQARTVERERKKEAEYQRKTAEKAEKEAVRVRRKADRAEKEAEKERKWAEKEAARASHGPPRLSYSQIPAPRFDNLGRPMR